MSTAPNHLTALVAEDDVLIRMDVADMLGEWGFHTLEAGSGDEAIVLLQDREGAVSLLFSDVDMPGSRNGFALAREVAATWPEIAIVIASGRFSPVDGDMPAGATFIGKPFSVETVRNHLKATVPEDQQPRGLKDG